MFLLRELIPKYKYMRFEFWMKVIVALILNECFRNIKGNGLRSFLYTYNIKAAAVTSLGHAANTVIVTSCNTYFAPAALNNFAHWPALKNSAVNWGAKSAYVHPGL